MEDAFSLAIFIFAVIIGLLPFKSLNADNISNKLDRSSSEAIVSY